MEENNPSEYSARKVLCWIGIIVLVILFLMYFSYDAPVSGGHWDYGEYLDRVGGYAWVEEYDMSGAPFTVRLVEDWNGVLVLVGIILLYGALKK